MLADAVSSSPPPSRLLNLVRGPHLHPVLAPGAGDVGYDRQQRSLETIAEELQACAGHVAVGSGTWLQQALLQCSSQARGC